MRFGWWRRARQKRDTRAAERSVLAPAERKAASGDLTALKTNQRAARMVLEPNVEDAERLAEGEQAEAPPDTPGDRG